jgi:hypothetical protein
VHAVEAIAPPPAHLSSLVNIGLKRPLSGRFVEYPEGIYPLSESHREHLRTSGLSDEIIAERGYLSASAHGVRVLESRISERHQRPGIIYPQFLLGAEDPHHYEIRPDKPLPNKNGKAAKYVRPSGVPQIPDVLPRFRPLLQDPTVTLYITEGVKKADALSDLGLLAVGLPGVYGYRTTNSAGGKTIHPDLREAVAWNGREVVLAFDSDWESNPKVKIALARLASVLATWGAVVKVVHLPQMPGSSKVGVDDYLVQFDHGSRLDHLLPLVKPFVKGGLPGNKLGDHPTTGQPLVNPPGFSGESGKITFTDPEKETIRVVYDGLLAVTATGVTLDGAEMLTVRFEVGKSEKRTVTAPRADLIRSKGVLDHLGAAGANVNESNARLVGRYIGEFAYLNYDSLPRTTFTDRLGDTGTGIIGPNWVVGEPANFLGKAPHFTVISDQGAYRDALQEIALWDEQAWIVRTILSLVAASPHLECLSLLRNPVIAIAAPSNLGKTTIARFASALYASPGHPIAINGNRSTLPGILQVLHLVNGLSLWIDEAHTVDSEILYRVVYSHANRQTYTRGGKDGVPLGGEPLRGTLLLTGEGLANLKTTGVRNRLLYVDGARNPVLGSRNAADRVLTLNRATETGAGSLGRVVTAHLWNNRQEWRAAIQQLALKSPGPDSRAGWHLIAAAAQVTLQYLYAAVNLDPGPHVTTLSDTVLQGVDAGWRDVDPARDAFDELRDTLLACRQQESEQDLTRKTIFSRDQSELAWLVSKRTSGALNWAVRATAVEVTAILNQYGGPNVVAREWQRRELIIPASDGRSTQVVKIKGKSIRCYLIPRGIFEGRSEASEHTN